MERATAVRKLTKLLGKNMGYRVELKAPDADDRAEAREQLRVLAAERDVLAERMEARRREILQGDAEFQRLRLAHHEARTQCQKLSSMSMHYRFTAGVTTGLFFHIKAQGDTWEEVIKKLEARP